MIAAVRAVDDSGVYVLFSEDDYAVEEFYTIADLQERGYDGSDSSLASWLRERIAFRLADKQSRDEKATPPTLPSVGFSLEI